MATSRRDYLKQMLLTGASLAAASHVAADQAAESGLKPQPSADLFAATHEQRITWWREARFGMFMHFGLYSVPSRGEWLLADEAV
jgi:alpha-L-fucosidase